MKSVVRALLVVVTLCVIAGGAAIYSVARRGLSTRAEPAPVEAILARAVRRLATSNTMRAQTNPVQLSHTVIDEALEHYADHCASCHANDGSGDTAIGRGLYPRAPDMRAGPTQALTDGELFSIIENGVRLTGMPAWGTGTPDGERASWALVHFIRHLPKITDEELGRMEALNPRSASQWKDEEAARRFLAGDDVTSAAPPVHNGSHVD